MKICLQNILCFIIGCAFGGLVYATYQAHVPNYHISTTPPEPQIEYVYIEKDPIVETEIVYVPYEEPFYRSLTEEDTFYLKDMAMREAEGEGVIGQCWVMYTVICRAETFGMSIKEVCESEAFKSSRNRSGLEPNDECNQALALIEEGWEPKPLWFRRDVYHGFATPLCQVGNHCFSTTLEEE